jgi:predicted Zn finger-like uncharacterized protein
MEVTCPNCSFTAQIDDSLIGESGRSASCPKCRHTFLVTKEETGEQRSENNGERFFGLGDMRVEPEIRTPKGKQPPPPSPVNWVRILVTVVLSVALFSFGFFAGYFTGTIRGDRKNTPRPPAVSDSERPGDKSTAGEEQEPPAESPAEVTSVEIPEAEPEETVPPPDLIESSGDRTVFVPPESLERWELYFGDTFVPIDAIDEKVQELFKSDYTRIQKEQELTEFGNFILGRNITAKLTVLEVREAVDERGLFPENAYFYIIEAHNVGEASPKCTILIGIEDAEEAMSLTKGMKIYVEGVIYSYRVVSDVYELSIINATVDTIF